MFNTCIYTYFFKNILTYWITWQHHYTQYFFTTINCTNPPPTPSILPPPTLGTSNWHVPPKLEPTEAWRNSFQRGPFFGGDHGGSYRPGMGGGIGGYTLRFPMKRGSIYFMVVWICLDFFYLTFMRFLLRGLRDVYYDKFLTAYY